MFCWGRPEGKGIPRRERRPQGSSTPLAANPKTLSKGWRRLKPAWLRPGHAWRRPSRRWTLPATPFEMHRQNTRALRPRLWPKANEFGFLRTRLDAVTADRNDLLERAAEERRRLEEVQSAYARLEIEIKRADLAAGGEAGAIHRAQAEAHLQLTRSAFDDAQARTIELEAALQEKLTEEKGRRARREAMEQEQTRLQSDTTEAAGGLDFIEARLRTLAEESAPAETELAATEQARAALEQEEAHLRAELQQAERRHSQAQIELARREEEQASLRRRVEDDFGLVAFDFDESGEGQVPIPFEGLVEHLAPRRRAARRARSPGRPIATAVAPDGSDQPRGPEGIPGGQRAGRVPHRPSGRPAQQAEVANCRASSPSSTC